MLKIIGASAIFLTSVIIGFLRSFRMKKRCDNLLALIMATERIGAEISFTKKRLERIFNETSRNLNLPVFSDAAIYMQQNGVKIAWDKSIRKYADDMGFNERDIKAAQSLGSVGDFTGDEQQRCIHTTKRLLELAHKEALDDYNRTGKLCRSCGVLCGMLVVILLF